MVKRIKNILVLSTLLLIIFLLPQYGLQTYAQEAVAPPPLTAPPQTQAVQTVKSNILCTSIGTPTTEKPAICNQQGTISGGPHPIAPPPPGDLQQAIKDQFGIGIIGFDQQHLQWTWEKLWEVSNTNFISLVRGSIMSVTDVSSTRQVGCPPNLSVFIGQFPEETAFKHILIHELGHVIRNCAGRQKAQETAFMNAHNAEGGVSYYAKNASSCTGSDSPSEDYAEMIAFYLNPGTPVKSYLKCYQQDQERLSPEQFPLHYQVAQDVLGAF